MAEITIIMPLYNAERYLSETLESVLAQTFIDFELLCVDDASTDGTMNIVFAFVKRDSRIKVLRNKERQGAAVSRNRGIQEAEGKYLIFLDGDDIFDEEMLEKAYMASEKYGTDVIRFQGKCVPSDDVYKKGFIKLDDFYRKKYCTIPFSLRKMKPYVTRNWWVSPCLQLFRKEYILENHLEFQTLSCCNDVYFVRMALLLANKMMVLDDDKIMVFARQHCEPSRISYYRDPMCSFYAFKKIQDELIKRGEFQHYFQHFYYIFLNDMLSTIKNCKEEKEAEKFYSFLQQEGISTVVERGKPWFHETDLYIRSMVEQFSGDYSSRWWINKNTILDILLMNHKEQLMELYNNCIRKKYRIALWGAGNNGCKIIEFCNENNIRLAAVVDGDLNKCGEMRGGYKIMLPEMLEDDIQVVIASNSQIYEENDGMFRSGKVKFWEIERYFSEER